MYETLGEVLECVVAVAQRFAHITPADIAGRTNTSIAVATRLVFTLEARRRTPAGYSEIAMFLGNNVNTARNLALKYRRGEVSARVLRDVDRLLLIIRAKTKSRRHPHLDGNPEMQERLLRECGMAREVA